MEWQKQISTEYKYGSKYEEKYGQYSKKGKDKGIFEHWATLRLFEQKCVKKRHSSNLSRILYFLLSAELRFSTWKLKYQKINITTILTSDQV